MVDDVVLIMNLRLAGSAARNFIAPFRELVWGCCILVLSYLSFLSQGAVMSFLSFDPCCWYLVMKLSSLQGDYNGEEIAKVMELVELEEAEKKRQGG